MILLFADGTTPLTTTQIEPTEDTTLPDVAMVGQYCFQFQELAYGKGQGEWVAVYQPASPLILPASQSVNSHYMLRQTIGQTEQ